MVNNPHNMEKTPGEERAGGLHGPGTEGRKIGDVRSNMDV
jgi:hypothetical protein